MIKVTPYALTTKSKKFEDFLLKSFELDMLYPIINEKPIDLLFDCWRGKNMINWFKFTNDDGVILEFYSKHYNVKINKDLTTYTLPFPKTINDFINDMYRLQIGLYWTNWIDFNFEPKEYLNTNEIKSYFVDLLKIMGKENELI